MIWHYTIGPKLALIAEDRALKPTSINIAPGEKPILWCSSDSHWERSCAKKTMDLSTGALRWMSWEEHVKLVPVRFRVRSKHVMQWLKVALRWASPATWCSVSRPKRHTITPTEMFRIANDCKGHP